MIVIEYTTEANNF